MYIDHIEIENFRTFRKSKISFCHADRDFEKAGEPDSKEEKMPRPRLPNLNLLLANNGHGKTSLLRAIALAALGPTVRHSGIYPYRLIRREAGQKVPKPAVLKAYFHTHPQDHTPSAKIESCIEIMPRGDLELLEWAGPDAIAAAWQSAFSDSSDAFFMVGYAATRRVSKSNRPEQIGKSSVRAARVMGLFEEDYTLRPLNTWLPRYMASKQLKGRYVQVVNLLGRLLGRHAWDFTGRQDEAGEYLYGKKGAEVPFPALSDGYRAFLGWLGDLLYHVCETCPSGKKLVENRGIVMVDEIDLHLHPKWQMTVLQTLAKELPNIQFIVTSHSPLIVGALEWMNIILMKPGTKQSSIARRIEWAVHGLDADQILLTDFFGLASTRAPGKKRALKELSLKARDGDTEAAKQILQAMSSGMEGLK
ncbi:MAG TPA: AAA family ATPase [Chthoniobacter sp.]|nr:AAA family ATPase [Chthoniobacter sp.]